MRVNRRAFVLAGATAALLVPTSAFAALHPPLKESPPRVQPLGRWALAARRVEVVQDGRGAVQVTAPLEFRPSIDVETPTMRWWRNATAQGQPARVAEPRGITIDPPRKLVLTPSMVSGVWVDAPITIDVGPTVRRGGFRISCEMVDPKTKRRAEYSFVLNVLDKART